MKLVRLLPLVILLAATAALLSACGEKKEVLGDTSAQYGPGVSESPPPWKPEYDHLDARIKKLGLPPVGKEQVHHHAVIHVYNDGLLVQVPANVGWLPQAKVYSSIHTHTPDGIIHMESSKPHQFKLGDFFYIWGVAFGKETLGGLHNEGDKQLNVYVNGKHVVDPGKYVIHEGDNIAVGYGTDDSFPHEPDKSALKTVNGGDAQQAMCTAVGDETGKPQSCVNPDAGGDKGGSSSSSGDPSSSPSGGN
jgi:hypothetical protein